MTPKYIVIGREKRTTRTFKDAEGVSVFMLGRRFSDYAIYQLQDDLPTEVNACASELKGREGHVTTSKVIKID
jgi:hypothetical protein